ncbi:MAG: ATP synthase F1 subunit gamma [Coriobacteriia bacterium]|nr:ATP synthase F1 subunit gamma [Coriobacteriia bacterium]
MANLRDIKKRINSVKSTKQITHTMEMVSSAKIRKATERILSSNPYNEAIHKMLAHLTESEFKNKHPLLQVHEEHKHVTFIIIVSDRGLAGGFNANILHAAEKKYRELSNEGLLIDVIVAGKKGISYFNYHNIPTCLSFTGLSADPTIAEAREISAFVRDRYINGETDEVILVYNHARNAADQDLMIEKVLPISLEALGLDEEEKPEFESFYEFEPSASRVLDVLLPDYLDTTIYHALIDSAAAEQGARRRAMKSATDNASEIITTLQRQYNSARQAAITTEISEIVGGAAALED